MVDELLKMIAECHLQKPQTTSKMSNFAIPRAKLLICSNAHLGWCLYEQMMLGNEDGIFEFKGFAFLGLNFREILHKCNF